MLSSFTNAVKTVIDNKADLEAGWHWNCEHRAADVSIQFKAFVPQLSLEHMK